MTTTQMNDRLAGIGRAYGQEEFEIARDNGRTRCEFTRGQFCGNFPLRIKSDEHRWEIEAKIDNAAAQEWDRLWDLTAPIAVSATAVANFLWGNVENTPEARAEWAAEFSMWSD